MWRNIIDELFVHGYAVYMVSLAFNLAEMKKSSLPNLLCHFNKNLILIRMIPNNTAYFFCQKATVFNFRLYVYKRTRIKSTHH